MKKNMLIAQSGGPSMVINQSLVGAVLAARSNRKVGKIYGALHGIEGVLAENFIDLRKVSVSRLNAIAETPSSALGSCRLKPDAEDCKKIFAVLRKLGIRYFFYIGGNDSADTARIINEEAVKAEYEMCCMHIAKTIDNDLWGTDMTFGFQSAVDIATNVIDCIHTTAASHGRVFIVEVMGHKVGWLTLNAGMASGADIILIPESFPLQSRHF